MAGFSNSSVAVIIIVEQPRLFTDRAGGEASHTKKGNRFEKLR